MVRMKKNFGDCEDKMDFNRISRLVKSNNIVWDGFIPISIVLTIGCLTE